MRPAAAVAVLSFQQPEKLLHDPAAAAAALFVGQRGTLGTQFVYEHADAGQSLF